jgi:hypothetical protein
VRAAAGLRRAAHRQLGLPRRSRRGARRRRAHQRLSRRRRAARGQPPRRGAPAVFDALAAVLG